MAPKKKQPAKKVIRKAVAKKPNRKEKKPEQIIKKTIEKKKVPPPKEKRAKAKPVEGAVPKAYSAYTVDQYKKYTSVIKEWSDKSNDEIKAQLSKNSQSKTGNKHDLLIKLADGMVLGSIPRCPNCFGGRPKFNQSTGLYNCPGFRDDVEFKNCHKAFTMDQLPRTPWVE